jgi:hypothetical protein
MVHPLETKARLQTDQNTAVSSNNLPSANLSTPSGEGSMKLSRELSEGCLGFSEA